MYQIWHLYRYLCDCTKWSVLPVLLCLSDASLIIADNWNVLGLIPLPAGRSVSACLISYVNYGDTCSKVSNLSLFVTQFRSRQELADLSLPLAFSIKCHTVPDSVRIPGSRFSSRFSSRFDKLDNNYIIHGTKKHTMLFDIFTTKLQSFHHKISFL